MPRKGPHISIASLRLVPRVLGIPEAELIRWPEDVRELAVALAEELFLVRYNPYVNAELVRQSVTERLRTDLPNISSEYSLRISSAVTAFWAETESDRRFKTEVIQRLEQVVPAETIVRDEKSLIEASTDATDLRIELPMLTVAPRSAAEVQAVVRLAGDMGFCLVPRGGGTGMTGGAIPARRRTVVLSLSRLKTIGPVDERQNAICAQAGVLTLHAIKAAENDGYLLTVDPASKAGSSIGGNIAENAGGPFAFEYGTTIDNLLSYTMVMPDARLVQVVRRDHPRHKIMPGDTAVFDVYDLDTGAEAPVETIRLHGAEIRGTGLGKDVTNKFLGGLPGVQKEGVDGIIVEGCFTLHPMPGLSRTVCLEFYGRSMHNAMLVIKDVVAYRDRIRQEGDMVKLSSLEEFNIKYVQAIGYEKKSSAYEGDPISVLLIRLDGDEAAPLDEAVQTIADMARVYDGVDAFVAEDDKQAELFWEDRHKLSAISRRTSGFKINEDIVIPIDGVPDFADFLEDLNLHYTALAYRAALQAAGKLPGVPPTDKTLDGEFITAMKILRGNLNARELNDQELEVQAALFFQDLENRYPKLREEIAEIFRGMLDTRVVIASHMHAGDGNCHVNIPVNSNDAEMLRSAHEAAEKVFGKVLELGGQVSGEHGIGITKIAFLQEEKLEALKAYKAQVDPRGLINPYKLTTRETPAEPYTFSFNRLIQDLSRTALPDKERLIKMLADIQTCTRCGKCKQVCPMYDPVRGLTHHPRNKNIALGALIEAIYYSQVVAGRPEPVLLAKLKSIIDHCTACGKCTTACSVKINTADVTLFARAFLSEKKADAQPIKHRVLDYLAKDPEVRTPMAAKLLSLGQNMQNRAVGLLPARWRSRLANPVLADKGPTLGFRNLAESLHLSRGSIFVPESAMEGREAPEAVYYFPGCGAALFSRSIGMAAVGLLLRAGYAVILPERHLCCGYPLLASGLEEAYLAVQDRNLPVLRQGLTQAKAQGLKVGTVLTSCGTCRESLSKYSIEMIFGLGIRHMDVSQFLLGKLPAHAAGNGQLVYHAACHAEWTGVHGPKAAESYRAAIARMTGAEVELSPGCCGESGLGALTAPAIYNRLRDRKRQQLREDLADAPDSPVLVGCPSCKIGIRRCIMGLESEGSPVASQREVLHVLEYLARQVEGPDWQKHMLSRLNAAKAAHGKGLRLVAEPAGIAG